MLKFCKPDSALTSSVKQRRRNRDRKWNRQNYLWATDWDCLLEGNWVRDETNWSVLIRSQTNVQLWILNRKRGHARTCAAGLSIDLHQLGQLHRLDVLLGLCIPCKRAQAPSCTRHLCAQFVVELPRDIPRFQLTFFLAQEQKELVWTE